VTNGFSFVDVDYETHDHAPRKVLSEGISATSTISKGLPSGTSLAAISSMVKPQSAGTITATPPSSVG